MKQKRLKEWRKKEHINSLLGKTEKQRQFLEPVPVAARSKAQVCGRSPAEIVGSNSGIGK